MSKLGNEEMRKIIQMSIFFSEWSLAENPRGGERNYRLELDWKDWMMGYDL